MACYCINKQNIIIWIISSLILSLAVFLSVCYFYPKEKPKEEEELNYIGIGISSVLDFIPFIGNLKNLKEGVSGKQKRYY